jgi:hypothetical protein
VVANNSNQALVQNEQLSFGVFEALSDFSMEVQYVVQQIEIEDSDATKLGRI